MTRGRVLVYLVPFLWLALFFLLPFVFVLKISLAQSVIAQPPYTPLVEHTPDGLSVLATLNNYRAMAMDRLYLVSYLTSLRIAFVSTVFCLLIGYPMAYAIARARGRTHLVLLMLVILPFWTSFLIRVYAWKVLLQGGGLINSILMALGIVDHPLAMLYTEGAVYVGIVYSYLPFMILPLYAALARLDYSVVEAALDLGCRPWQAFAKVTLPLSAPGILAGSLLVFIPAVGEFVIPELLGGPDSIMIGRVLWNEFFANRDWPLASAVAIVMLLILVAPIAALQNSPPGSCVKPMRRSVTLISLVAFGYAFLYLPILTLVAYSFNASERVMIWQGFSTRWYGALMHDQQILAAAWLSFRIALVNATAATVLGLLAGYVMVRFGRFRTRTLFSAMLAAPLVVPDVITGLSLLMLFIALESLIGWPGSRGATTIAIAHITFCTAYVAVVVQSRLGQLDPALEEAAMDLGARPVRTFLLITVPLLVPALLAGWLLSFTLSIDDLVIASFVSGPGASTLPMVIFSKVRLGLSPEINALATLLIAAVLAGVSVAMAVGARRGGGAAPASGRRTDSH